MMTMMAMELLATVRLTALVTQDELTTPLRWRVEDATKDAEYGSFRERFAYLVGCDRCTSMWAAAAVLLLSRSRWGRVVVRALAMSQLTIWVLRWEEQYERRADGR